ncbi:MAG: carboxypeptidase regulatory-like domain-containing protein [Acidobacteriaceae bacterium]
MRFHRNSTKMIQRFVLCLIALLWLATAHSQVSTGSILGEVTDPTGAVVSGAKITITNVATNEAFTSTSNRSGLYTVPNLAAGRYRVDISTPNFSSESVQDVILHVGEQRTVDFTLKVGSTNSRIVVTATPATVDLDTSIVMPVVNESTIVGLPLNGRDWASLATLQPGVDAVRTQSVLSISNQRANRGVGNQITASGARPQTNNYRLDGISINDYSNGGPSGVVGLNLGVDAIEEFSVITGLATADYGRTAGGIVNAVTRTGTNQFHGDAYEFFRNSFFDARNPFDSVTGVAPLRRNQFGASAGGPIVRDRTFFFGNYEGLRWFNSVNTSSTVPSPDARAGLLCAGTGCSHHTQIPVPASLTPYIAFYPLPNNPAEPAPVGNVAGGTSDTGNFLYADPFTTAENYYIAHIDHKISRNDQLAGTFFVDRGSYTAPDGFDEKVTGNILNRVEVSVTESHTITANLLNSTHVGYNRVYSDAPTTLNAIDPASADTSLGFVPGLTVGLINIGGISNFTGGLGAVGEYKFNYNSYQVYEDLFWNRGKHSLKVGFAFERLQNNQLGTGNPNGQFTFGSWTTFLENSASGYNGPIPPLSTTPRDLRQSIFAGYITDDYHILRNLTLNLGVRYELATVPTETDGRLSNLPTLTAAAPRLGSPYFQNATERNFAPRVGFAYSPFRSDKTVIHGGYGVYDALALNYLFEGLSILTAPYYETGSISNGLAGTFPAGASPLLNATSLRYAYTPQHQEPGYVQQWGLNVQQELPGNAIFQVGYAASHGVHLPYREDDINTVLPLAGELPGGVYEFPSLSNNISAATTNPRLNPNVGQISAFLPYGYSEYDALQTGITKRLTHRIQFQASYTWGKSIDDGSSSTFGDTFANSVSSLPYFARDRRRAVSDFNVGQTFVVNYLFELPNAPKSFGPAGWVLDRWQYAGLFTAAKGLPITPQISGDPLGLRSSDTFAFPNFNYGTGCNPVNPQNKAHYINLACYSYPTESATYNPFLGTAGRNSINGPGLQSWDTSLVKDNHIPRFGESFDVQFRAEVFNILNRSNYNNPLKAGTQLFSAAPAPTAGKPTPALVGAPLTSSAGAISSTATSSRQLQFALKVIF